MFTSFTVGPEKGLQLAALTEVPRLLVVSGPNGAGKSTMLELLHRQKHLAEPGTRVMYITPNRPWRRSSVTALATLGLASNFRSMVEANNNPNWQYGVPPGMQFMQSTQGQVRSRDTVDDVLSLVKLAILQLETRRQRAITGKVDAGARGDELDFDAYEPLRKYISSLLPHLRFVGVETENQNEQRVVFEKLDAEVPVELELDDLSSGEKAVVGLMFPFIEGQADRIMSGMTAVEPVTPTVLIDEPELHLHPALQHNLMAYMRELAEGGEAQFILCTHSTTMIDAANEGELFVLAPPAVTGGNQLLPVATDAGRLATVRELTGSAFAVTRCRPIIFVEGEPVGAKAPSDHRIIELLVPESKGWVLVPAHGRAEAVRAATDIRAPALTGLPGLPVFALVDNDQGYDVEPDYVITWPAAMQENLLLDAEALWDWLSPHVKPGSPIPTSKVRLVEQLHRWCRDRRDREISLRVRRYVPVFSEHVPVTDTADLLALSATVDRAVADYVSRIGGAGGVSAAVQRATDEVDSLLAQPEKALGHFHGKELLDRLFSEYAAAAGWSGKAAFAYNLAAIVRATNSARLREMLVRPVRRIEQYLPAALVKALIDLASDPHAAPDTYQLRDRAIQMRTSWEAGTETDIDRVLFRSDVLRQARLLQTQGRIADQESLVSALAEFVVS